MPSLVLPIIRCIYVILLIGICPRTNIIIIPPTIVIITVIIIYFIFW